MVTPKSPNPDGYVHARDADEYQRLRNQAAMWRGATEALLDQIGLKPGMSCLDVGAGPGLVMRLMADRVGPDGTVTGLEIDSALGAQALADLKRQGGADFRLVEANVLETATVPGAPFDLTYCRLLLMHMQEPVRALAGAGAGAGEDAGLDQARRRGRGAGIRLRRDRDRADLPSHGGVQPLVRRGVSRPRRNLRAGRQLPAQFEAAGIGSPDGTVTEVKYLPLSDMAAMLIGVYQGLFASAVELGIANPALAEAFKEDMAEAAADGRYYCLTPIMIGAWKRVS
jgi:SAM-dependent methyltransferase